MARPQNLLPCNDDGCPYLLLAPMEGVGDTCFRKAISSIGGFDEAVRDFLRVPANAHVESLSRVYNPHELGATPLAVQIMGSDTALMALMAQELVKKGAHRIDINCGCPSHTVTGRGAGSSLLKDPNILHEVVKSVVEAVDIPVTVKMRSGFEDTSLFEDNLLAAQSTGVAYITLHPRTKVDGYTPPAKWELIARAKEILSIPLVGNGDILTVEDAHRMLFDTKCDALMIGRGSLINPFLFHQIKASFAKKTYLPPKEALSSYLDLYLEQLQSPARMQVNKLKQLLGFLLKNHPQRLEMLKSSSLDPLAFLAWAKQFL